MVAAETLSPSPPPLQVPFHRMEPEGNHERDVTTTIPALLCNDNECRNTVDVGNTDDEMAVLVDLSLSCRSDTEAAAVLDAEVVKERDLHQEVQERMNSMTIDAMLVVNMSSNEEENNKTRTDSRGKLRGKSTAIRLLVAAALIIITVAMGTAIGTIPLRRKPLASMVTAPPTASISVVDFAINIFTSLSGEEALMDESSPQYKALWWMVRDDPANLMMKMMVGNETQSLSPSSSSSSSMLTIIMERYVMALLYFGTDGPNWVSPYDFLGIESICDWGEPIGCSEQGSAVRIRIGN
jgi:hypothetical protein